MDDLIRLLASENRALLGQVRELVMRMSPQLYARRMEDLACGSMGQQVRHVVSYYDAFLRASSTVDYDKRERQQAMENSPALAVGRLTETAELLTNWAEGSRPPDRRITVRESCIKDLVWVTTELPSSLARELAFLGSHTVHHMAIMAMLARGVGVQPAADFGVAKATRQYLEDSLTGLRKDSGPGLRSALRVDSWGSADPRNDRAG